MLLDGFVYIVYVPYWYIVSEIPISLSQHQQQFSRSIAFVFLVGILVASLFIFSLYSHCICGSLVGTQFASFTTLNFFLRMVSRSDHARGSVRKSKSKAEPEVIIKVGADDGQTLDQQPVNASPMSHILQDFSLKIVLTQL